MAVKRTVTRKKTLDTKALAEASEQFLTLEKTIKEYEDRKAKLRMEIVDMVEQFGETDDKDHVYIDLPEPIDGIAGWKWESRKSTPLDVDVAEGILKRKGLLKKAQTTITVLDESKIEALYYEDEITKTERAKMFPVKENRALQKVKS